MENADDARGKVFSFIDFGKDAKNNIANRMKETIEQRSILEEINTEFIRDSEHTVTMNARNQLAGHMKRAGLIVTVTARRAETAFAAEGDEFKVATVRTAIHGTAIRRVTTMKHPVDIFDNRSTWSEFINHMFIIIIKDGL